MTRQLQIFVSSRIQHNEAWRDLIASVCEQCGHEPVLFPERSEGERKPDDYIKALEKSDIVVYLIDRPSSAVDKEINIARKDGKPLIILAQRSYIGDGIWSTTALARTAPDTVMLRKFDGPQDLQNIVRIEIAAIIARRFAHPKRHIRWGPDTYTQTISSIRTVREKFAILQETSSIVLGPHRDRLGEEGEFLDEFFQLLEGNRHCQIIHLFDQEKTQNEYLHRPEDYPQRGEWQLRLRHLLSPPAVKANCSNTIVVAAVASPISPMMIADDTIMTGHFFGRGQKRASFHQEVGEWAATAWRDAMAAAKTGIEPIKFLRDLQG